MSDDYEAKKKAGEDYERYVFARLETEWGMKIQRCDTYAEQKQWGDSRLIEIKFDREFVKTGNLCIETHERPAQPGAPEGLPWVDSGIQACPNGAFLFGIGNYTDFYVFTKSRLLQAWRGKLGPSYNNNRSQGFLLSRVLAERMVEAQYRWKAPTP